MTDRIIKFIVSRCRLLAVLCIISTIIPLCFLQKAKIDNSIEVWLGTENKALEEYRNFLAKYGNEEFIVVAAVVDDPLGKEWLSIEKSIVNQLKQIEDVQNVLNIASIAEQLSKYKPDWKTTLSENEFLKDLLFGNDKHISGMIVWLKKLDNHTTRRVCVEEIESVLHDANPQTDFYMAGTPLLNVCLDRGSRQASGTFMPIALAISIIILFVILRNIKGVIAVICAIGVTTIWTVGLMIIFGKSINMVTVTLPSLIFVLSLSSGIHITIPYLRLFEESVGIRETIRKVLDDVLKPILLSNVTTSLGFASLMVAKMQPVIDFGFFASLGMLLSFLITIIVVPGMLLLLRTTPEKRDITHSHFTSLIGKKMFRHKNIVHGISLVVLIVSILITTKSRVESNVLQFFPDNSKITRDYNFIGNNLTGFYTVELDMTTDLKHGKTLLEQITSLGKILEERPEVAKVIHYGKTSSLRQSLMGTAAVPFTYFAGDNQLKQLSQHYVSKKNDQLSLRMSVFIRSMASSEFYSLLNFINLQANQVIGDFAKFKITGVVPLLNAAQKSLIDTQIRSFAIAIAMVLILIGMFMKSFRALIASLLPNILPIFSLFAIMVLMNIPLDAATVMIASVAIGIAADDTVHFLSHYREERLLTDTGEDAVETTFQKVGTELTFTSIIAVLGFLILDLASFKPIQYFGLLAGLTMITAWISDVFVLPASIASIKLWEKNDTVKSQNNSTSPKGMR